jgi:AraC-like DNA-binding protein
MSPSVKGVVIIVAGSILMTAPPPTRTTRRTEPAAAPAEGLHVVRPVDGRSVLVVPPPGRWPFVVVFALSEALTLQIGDRPVPVAGGGSRVLRNTGPIRVCSDPTGLLAVFIPADALGVYRQTFERVSDQTGTDSARTPGLVAHLLQGLAEPDAAMAGSSCRVAQHVVGLLTLIWSDEPTEGSGRDRLAENSKAYIDAHLGDADLTAERIASELHVSTRTLHRLFEAEQTTIGSWIRGRRLEQCRLDLTDRRLQDEPVSQIAARWGLWDPAHFSRVFKATFGLSPRVYRMAHRHDAARSHPVPPTAISASA